MKILRVVLAAAVIFLCVISFVVLTATIFGVWTFNRFLTDAVVGSVAPIERIVTQAHQGLDGLDERVSNAQAEVVVLQAEVDALTAEIAENRELRASLAATLTARLEPVVQVAGHELGQVRDGLTAVNRALDVINRLPLIELNLPRLERLQEIESNLTTLARQ